MNYESVIGFALFFCAIAGITLYFVLRNKRLEKSHKIKRQQLSEAIVLHKTQIAIRENALNKYHFLRYNLDEALVVQTNINI
ncbi:MAG: hypothetical protein OQJ83_07180 [Altibacter sp.]|uniref:hypothetical protein n=1 Tax=Altibacter lentus TaxID=1223410 RepID=UPI0005585E74|nr:hypothetical protein [Altibacter lentus]MCW8981153.1 hypothetical protein [Altibacter sp.]